MIVLKFGGTSVGSAKAIFLIEKILKSYISQGKKIAVVCSAFSGVTDLLLNAAKYAASNNPEYKNCIDHIEYKTNIILSELFTNGLEFAHNESNAFVKQSINKISHMLDGIYALQEATPKSLDFIASHGEVISSFIISKYLVSKGVHCSFCDARDFIKTNSDFGNAKIDFGTTNGLISEYFESRPEPQIITGFIGSTSKNETTTLGRGGSDYTAAVIGAALDVAQIEIWTDVDGVLTADPRKVKKAMTIDSMTYSEAFEMSHFGAKVIYPPTIIPATSKKIPVLIKNTFNPEFIGTRISEFFVKTEKPVKGISSISTVALLNLEGSGLFGVPGIAGRLFTALARDKVNVILITQVSSEHSISFAIDPSDIDNAHKAINNAFFNEIKQGIILPVKIETGLAIVAVVGENMRFSTGVAGKMMNSLGKNGINIVAIAQGSSEINISVVIQNVDESKALNAIHNAFFLSEIRSSYLFIAGVGLIGGTLLQQLEKQHRQILQEKKLDIKVMALSNSKNLTFSMDYEGISLSHWKDQLILSQYKSNPKEFIDKMIQFNLPNSVFVDNTSSNEYTPFYEHILSRNISISTPNKSALTQSFDIYKKIRFIQSKKNVFLGYETNVGAGLPVISTIRNLLSSGDVITSIQGVLSGSLSYIFNSFNSSSSFFEIVQKAGELGYLEPDPRIDLFGLDFRRKVLILARECGYKVELEDVVYQSFLPDACLNAKSVDDFMAILKEQDSYFHHKVLNAEKNQCKLRLLGEIRDGHCQIKLELVDSTNPLYFLSGSDNMLVIHSTRYDNRPLVIQGPGAGAEVTAAGVFAEIIQFSS